MPDWKQLVRERMDSRVLPSGCREEVIGELAAHLEETFNLGHSRGLSEQEALDRALQEVDDWDVLAKEIRRAKSEEDSMNQQRTRKLWLPALASITFTAVLLVVFDRIHMSPLAVGLGHLAMMLQLAWFAGMPLLAQT